MFGLGGNVGSGPPPPVGVGPPDQPQVELQNNCPPLHTVPLQFPPVTTHKLQVETPAHQ